MIYSCGDWIDHTINESKRVYIWTQLKANICRNSLTCILYTWLFFSSKLYHRCILFSGWMDSWAFVNTIQFVLNIRVTFPIKIDCWGIYFLSRFFSIKNNIVYKYINGLFWFCAPLFFGSTDIPFIQLYMCVCECGCVRLDPHIKYVNLIAYLFIEACISSICRNGYNLFWLNTFDLNA